MSRVYMHNNSHKNKLNNLMLWLLIPFMIFGFYKNGIKLYSLGYVNFLEMFKPIIMIVISVVISYLFSKWNKEDFVGYPLLCNILISMCSSLQLNIFIYLGLLIGLNILIKFVKVNIVPIFMIIDIIAMKFLPGDAFLNTLEESVTYSYSVLDYFLGKGFGGVSNTLLIMSVISLVLLILNIEYKKHIPLTAFITYYSLIIIYAFISSNASIDLFINNNVIFGFIFISTISIYTPYSKGACYIYGLLLGILTFASIFVDVNLGVYIVILVLGILSFLFDRFIVGKTNKNLIEVL